MSTIHKVIIGRLEKITLPQLHIHNLPVKVDTGAKTSSLHVDNICEYSRDATPHVSFDLHPDTHQVKQSQHCHAPIKAIRKIKSSNGEIEVRYVIQTQIQLGAYSWEIEVTLADRSDMNYLMLLGREAMGKRFLVDPSKIFIGCRTQ